MSHSHRSFKKKIATALILLFASTFISACSSNKTEVSQWWYHQEYEAAANSN